MHQQCSFGTTATTAAYMFSHRRALAATGVGKLRGTALQNNQKSSQILHSTCRETFTSRASSSTHRDNDKRATGAGGKGACNTVRDETMITNAPI
jgi:hypothetical protein